MATVASDSAEESLRSSIRGPDNLCVCGCPRGAQGLQTRPGVRAPGPGLRILLCFCESCSTWDSGARSPESGGAQTELMSGIRGLLLDAPCGCRCAMGIAAGRLAWASLCHGDCWAARPLGGGVFSGHSMGGAVSVRLVSRACSGWRRVLGIADQGVAWVAPYVGIGDKGIVWVALCHWIGDQDVVWAARVLVIAD